MLRDDEDLSLLLLLLLLTHPSIDGTKAVPDGEWASRAVSVVTDGGISSEKANAAATGDAEDDGDLTVSFSRRFWLMLVFRRVDC